MPTIEGESTSGLPRWIHIESAPEKPGWVRLTIELKGKKVQFYSADVKLYDLKQAMKTFGG